MLSISEAIQSKAKAWVALGEVTCIAEINNGFCADFANAIASEIVGSIIHGVYDVEDISSIPGYKTKRFVASVAKGDVAHSAIFIGGKFYDAECPTGVERFEDLPVNQRSLM